MIVNAEPIGTLSFPLLVNLLDAQGNLPATPAAARALHNAIRGLKSYIYDRNEDLTPYRVRLHEFRNALIAIESVLTPGAATLQGVQQQVRVLHEIQTALQHNRAWLPVEGPNAGQTPKGRRDAIALTAAQCDALFFLRAHSRRVTRRKRDRVIRLLTQGR